MLYADLVVMGPCKAGELDKVQLVLQIMSLASVLVYVEHSDMDPVRAATAEGICHEVPILAESCTVQRHLQPVSCWLCHVVCRPGSIIYQSWLWLTMNLAKGVFTCKQ